MWNWKREEVPDFVLAFVMCSAPGLRLPSLVPDSAQRIAAKSAPGRNVLRNMRRDGNHAIDVKEIESAHDYRPERLS